MLTILGGGGWFPAHGRQTASALLRMGPNAVLIDAGTGVCRLIERRELLDGVERLDILLTHFHLDHIAGLAYLPATGLCSQTTLWGPGELLYGCSTFEVLARIAREPVHPVPLARQPLAVRDLPRGEVEIAGVRVATRRQDRHTAPSLAYRFDDRLTWITDTAYDPGSARFAAGCEVLAHEAWFQTARPRDEHIHSSAAQAAQIAAQAGVERLLLIHLPPFQESVEGLVSEARATAPAAEPARDGMAVALPAR